MPDGALQLNIPDGTLIVDLFAGGGRRMTPAEEHILYQTDRAAWAALASARLAGKLMAMRDAHLATSWGYLTRETQTTVWQHLDESQRERVRALRVNAH